MAAPAPAIGHATITGATIYYINDVPATWADLKSELTVLEGFVTAWNADKPVSLCAQPAYQFIHLSHVLCRTTIRGYLAQQSPLRRSPIWS